MKKLLIFLLLLAGCKSADQNRLNIGGATFVYPMIDKWASIYEKHKNIQVNYNSIGSGGGIQQMTARTFDFGCTDAPMNEEQLNKAKQVNGQVVHIPLVLGAVVPAFNIPGINETINFNDEILEGIYLNKIKKWNDEAIKRINLGLNLPNLDIIVVHRADGSGTTYIWSEYLSTVSAEWKLVVGKGTSLNWPIGVGQKGNEGVTRFITQNPGAIGYIELIYALSNNVNYGAVKNSTGKFVKANLISITAAAKNALITIPDDLRYSLINAPGEDSYPISGTNWAVVYEKQHNFHKTKLIVDFLHWVTHEGQQYVEDLHYAKLPEGLVKKLEEKLKLIKY